MLLSMSISQHTAASTLEKKTTLKIKKTNLLKKQD
jgi:hypothetical protein